MNYREQIKTLKFMNISKNQEDGNQVVNSPIKKFQEIHNKYDRLFSYINIAPQ